MTANIYWLRHKDHSDLFNQGYIGVSKNPKERIRHHFKNAFNDYHSDKVLSKAIKKYGKESIICDILLSASSEYCYEIEKKLRPKAFVGWNMTIGGYHTPNYNPKGNKQSKEIVKKRTQTIIQKRNNQSVGMDKAVLVNGIRYNNIKKASEANGISYSQLKRKLRNHCDVEKTTGNVKFSHLKVCYANNKA